MPSRFGCAASKRWRVRGWSGKTTGCSRACSRRKATICGQHLGIVGALGAMHGGQRVGAPGEAEPIQHVRAPGGGGGEQGRVVHHVADVVDAGGDPLAGEIGDRGLGRAQQERAQMIGQHAVDLFRHAAVERAQAGFEMGDRDVQLRRRQRAGEGRVGVARHQHQIRPLVEDQRARPRPASGRSSRRGRRRGCRD